MTDEVCEVPALHNQYAIRQGATARIEMDFVDAANVAPDLTDHTIKAEIRKQDLNAETRGTQIAAWVADVSDAASGKLVLTIADTVTADMPVGTYVWDALLRAPDGTVRYFAPNTVAVVAGVTEPFD